MNLEEIAVPLNYGRAMERWPSAQTLSGYYNAIKTASNGLNHGLVEHVKSFIESICVTVLTELDEEIPNGSPSTTELLVAALRACGVHNTRDATSLSKFLSAFNKMADALSEMRNLHGPVAHGKDGFLDAICSNHARSFLHVGDTLIGVLLAALEGTEPDLIVTREPYSRFEHLSKKIDQVVSMSAKVESDEAGPILIVSMNVAGKREEVVNMRIVPSRLLFGLDRDAFVEVLKEVPADLVVVEAEAPSASLSDEVETAGTSEAPPPEGAPPKSKPETSARLLISELTPVVGALTEFLKSEAVQAPESLAAKLAETAAQNLGVDWKQRESLQAGLRLSMRRMLILNGTAPEVAGLRSERLVEWLKNKLQTPASSAETPE